MSKQYAKTKRLHSWRSEKDTLKAVKQSANCKPAEEVVEALCAAQCEAWQSHHLKLARWSHEQLGAMRMAG